ncbi:MAG: flavodoxin family protein [Thermofilaceae archaeon]
MRALIVSASPRKEGLCARISRSIAGGVVEAGGDADIVYLSDVKIGPCRACDNAVCWREMKCTVKDDALKLREMFNKCDAFALIAPVYFLSVNGLAKNFIDRMRYYGENGKPAVAVAVAGGTGKGCIFALQEMCRWLVLVGFRPTSLIPVTRYNFDLASAEAKLAGKRLVNAKPQPFKNLAEKLAFWEMLPYMRYTTLDEMVYLARETVNSISRKGKHDLVVQLVEELEKVEALKNLGLHTEALKQATEVQEASMKIYNSI